MNRFHRQRELHHPVGPRREALRTVSQEGNSDGQGVRRAGSRQRKRAVGTSQGIGNRLSPCVVHQKNRRCFDRLPVAGVVYHTPDRGLGREAASGVPGKATV